MNEPNPVLISAAHAIFASTDPRYIPSILEYVEDYRHSYLRTLQKYCPEWSQKNSEDLRPLMTSQIQMTQAPQDWWSQYWSQMNAYVNQGPQGLFSALQLLQYIRAHDSCAEHQTLLHQYLMTTLLPTINAYFLPQLDSSHHYVISPTLLANALSVLQVMNFLHVVCPRESEYLLHLTELSVQIVEAVRRTSSDPAFVRAVEQEAKKLAPLTPSATRPPSRVSQTPQTPQVLRDVAETPAGLAVEAGVFPDLRRVDSVVLNDSTQRLEAMGMRRRETSGAGVRRW